MQRSMRIIPQADPGAFVRAHRQEIDAALARVLDSGRYIQGPEVQAFEEEFAAFAGIPHAIAVANGTEALWLGLLAAGIKPGDEVIVPSLTASATAAAVVQAGAVPVFVDVREGDLTMDPDLIPPALTPRTRAILPVHLYGNPADLPALASLCERYNLLLIEDCSQAHGARPRHLRPWQVCPSYSRVERSRKQQQTKSFSSAVDFGESLSVGTAGALGAFSFYPTKNLGALGDGGAVVTADAELAARVRLLREYGWQERYNSSVHGWNSRLDELQAAILRVKLAHLNNDTERRREIASQYLRGLDPVRYASLQPSKGAHGVYHLYVIRVKSESDDSRRRPKSETSDSIFEVSERRKALRAHLAERGVGTAIHYPVPVHLQPAYSGHGRGPGSLPITEQACREILSLPIYPELSEEEVERVISAVNDFRV